MSLTLAPVQLNEASIFVKVGEQYTIRQHGWSNTVCGGAIMSTTVGGHGFKMIKPSTNRMNLNGVSFDVDTLEPTKTYTLTDDSVIVMQRDGLLLVKGRIGF